jgi:hypothetical protein
MHIFLSLSSDTRIHAFSFLPESLTKIFACTICGSQHGVMRVLLPFFFLSRFSVVRESRAPFLYPVSRTLFVMSQTDWI